MEAAVLARGLEQYGPRLAVARWSALIKSFCREFGQGFGFSHKTVGTVE
jgi:hypothetical protein